MKKLQLPVAKDYTTKELDYYWKKQKDEWQEHIRKLKKYRNQITDKYKKFEERPFGTKGLGKTQFEMNSEMQTDPALMSNKAETKNDSLITQEIQNSNPAASSFNYGPR